MFGQIDNNDQVIPILDKLANEYDFYIEIMWGDSIAIYENASDVIPATAYAVTLIDSVYKETDTNFLECIKRTLNRFDNWLDNHYEDVKKFRKKWNQKNLEQLENVALGWYDEP